MQTVRTIVTLTIVLLACVAWVYFYIIVINPLIKKGIDMWYQRQLDRIHKKYNGKES